MTERPQECAQTLHGYARGHHLLSSGGDIRESELHELDRLSDLSGYLPADAQFEAYHTGFPCGRYYALACTWPDLDAPRRGTVLTHTLLIPRDEWCEEADPFRWLGAHRRPVDATDLAPYRAVVPKPARASELAPALRKEELHALIWLWYGQPVRPLLWVEDPPPLRIVRALWPWLWAEARGSFAFCTFGLQARSLRSRPFDLLGVPSVAVGAFHELRDSPAWWLHERLRTQGTQDSWLNEFVERGPEAVGAMVMKLRKEGLGPPADAGYLRAVQRYLELEEGSLSRLSAARARLDMLGRVWPNLDEDHPAVINAIERLLRHQRSAPLEPRPLWDLKYLLAQPPVQQHLNGGGPVHDKLVACIEEETELRVRAVGSTISPDLAELYKSAPKSARPAMCAGIQAGLSVVSEDEFGSFVSLLDLAFEMQDRPLEFSLLQSLPRRRLYEWIERCTRDNTAFDQAGREQIVSHAISRMAPRLAFAAWSQDPLQGLTAAASVVDKHPNTWPEFEALLREQESDVQLEWCLTCETSALYELVARVGAELVQATKPDLMRLAALCDERPFGPAIFVKVGPSARDADLDLVLTSFPTLARGLVRHSLEKETPPRSLGAATLRLIPAGLLWERPLLTDLSTRSPSTSFIGALVKRLLNDVVTAQLGPADAAEWFESPNVRDWLESATNWDITGSMWQGPIEQGVRRLCQTIVNVRRPPPLGVVRPLLLLLQRAMSDVLERELESLLDVLVHLDPGESVGVIARAEILGAIRYKCFGSAWRLVEECFYPSYSAAGTDQNIFERIAWWVVYSPDRQRYWRHWLLETWVREDWPRDAFVRCLGGDQKLARRVFKRAKKKSSTTRRWLESLEPELRETAGLYQEWKEIL